MSIGIFDKVIDERFLQHRLKSTSLAGIVGEVLTICSFAYRFYRNGVLELGSVCCGHCDRCSEAFGNGLVSLNRLSAFRSEDVVVIRFGNKSVFRGQNMCQHVVSQNSNDGLMRRKAAVLAGSSAAMSGASWISLSPWS